MTKKTKSKISKVKRNNQTSNKMAKQGKSKLRRHRPRQPQQQRPAQPARVPSDESEPDVTDMVEEEDLEYIRKMPNSLLSSVPAENTAPKAKPPRPPRRKRKTSGSESDIEEEYEAEMSKERNAAKKMKPLLPIKTKQGIVTQEIETDASSEDEQPPPKPSKKKKETEEDEHQGSSEESEKENVDLFDDQQMLSAADLMLARKEELREKKYKIGTLASGLLESPEKKLRNFYALLTLMDEKMKDDTPNLMSVRKLATVSMYEVFKDILPEYQIKHQDYANVKLKKDTLALYKYEKELLEFYKRFLQRLERAANVLRRKRGDHRKMDLAAHKLGLISLQCMCGIMSARPYFNYATNICQTVVPFLNNRDAEARRIVGECCSTIFSEDSKGEISLVIVRRLNHLVKSRSHNIHPDALKCLLSLRIKDVDLDAEKELDLRQRSEEQKKKRLLNLSKKEKKRNKKLKEVEQELLETKAEESRLNKKQNLTEITKTAFLIYFRILKTAPQSNLLSATLEGLSKFAHVINLDYYTDLVKILSNLLSEDVIGYRQRLHCVRTVFAILSGQGDALNIDPSLFYKHIYANMLTVHAGKTHEDTPIILETLESILVKRRRKISQQVLLALVKRLGTLALQLQHNGALACLALINTVAQHSKAVESLVSLDDTVGSGRYDALLLEPEYCGANATALFECAILRRHYHPTVKKMAENITTQTPVPTDLAKLSSAQCFKQYDGSQIAFKPSIPVPPKAQPKKKIPTHHTFAVLSFSEYCDQISSSVKLEDFNLFSK